MTEGEINLLLTACALQWAALGLLMWRVSRLERRFTAFTSEPQVYDETMQDLEIRRDLRRLAEAAKTKTLVERYEVLHGDQR